MSKVVIVVGRPSLHSGSKVGRAGPQAFVADEVGRALRGVIGNKGDRADLGGAQGEAPEEEAESHGLLSL